MNLNLIISVIIVLMTPLVHANWEIDLDSLKGTPSSSPAPDSQITPGILCTTSDTDYKGHDYPEKIARCNRNVSEQDKHIVASYYGNIPRDSWSDYEFDHLIPLCAGGSNDLRNLWPEPIKSAKQKDVLEVNICTAMKAGTMTQAEAVQKVHNWFLARTFDQTDKKIKFSCLQLGEQSNSSISVDFQVESKTEVSNILISLVQNGNKFEVKSSGETPMLGRYSQATDGPLKNLIFFSLKDNDDRFYFYAPSDYSNRESFRGFLKIAFDGTYPKLVNLKCEMH